MGMNERITPWRGRVTLEAHDARTGRLVDRVIVANAYTTAGAQLYASALAGGTGIALSHIDLGSGGYTLSACDSASGWSTAPTVDAATFREGIAALKGTAAASGSVVYAYPTSVGGTAVMSSPTASVDMYLRLTSRSAVDLAGSYVRVYSPSSAYRQISFAGIETATGLPMADSTWTRCAIPTSAAGWATGSGSPAWGTVTGVGVVVKAAGAGTATVHWDQMLGLTGLGTATSELVTYQSTPGSRGLTALTGLWATAGTVSAQTAWAESEMVGDVSYAGIYANSGATLVAVAPLVYYKSPSVVLTVTWTIDVAGG